MCDTRLDAPGGADTHGAGGETYGDAAGSAYDGSAYAGHGGEGAAFTGEGRRDGGLPTDIPSPQFKGAGDVISPTLEVYRKHFLLVGLLVLVSTLPLVLLQYSLYTAIYSDGFESGGSGSIGAAAVGAGVGGTLLYWVLTGLGNALLSGALAYVVVQVQRTGAARAGESLMWGLTKLPKLVAVTLISYLLTYGVPLMFMVVMIFTVGPLLTFLAFLLLLLPWIVLMLTFSMAVPAAAVENRGVIESLSRSIELTRGHKGLIFLTYFLWWVVIILLNAVTTWSFYYGGDGTPEVSLVTLLVQMLAGGMLNSSMFVLTVYIFLGILNEGRQGFATNAYAHGPAAAAR
jgi:hypothetical protein